MTIFCVKVLLFIVISKNVNSSAKHARHFCNFKVYGLTLIRGCSLELIIITKFSTLDVCWKLLTIVARLLILDVLVVFAMFINHLICAFIFLEKIHKYGNKKEMKSFSLIQWIGASLGEDEPSEKENVHWWNFTLKHIFIIVFNQSKTKTLFHFRSKKALASMISKGIRKTCSCNVSVFSMVSLSSFFWNNWQIGKIIVQPCMWYIRHWVV